MNTSIFGGRRPFAAFFIVVTAAVAAGCGGSGADGSPPVNRGTLVHGLVLLHEEGTPRDSRASPLQAGPLPGFPLLGTTVVVRKITCAGPGPLDACAPGDEVKRVQNVGSTFDVNLPPGAYSFRGLPADPTRFASPMKEWVERSQPVTTEVIVGGESTSIYVFYDYPPGTP